MVKNRLNIASDDADESKIVDDDNEPEGECVWWLLLN